MSPKQKRDLIDRINEAFLEQAKETHARKYRKNFKRLVDDILTKRPRTRREIADLIRKNQIDIKDNLLLFTVLNTVTSLIARRPTKEEQPLVAPIQEAMKRFNVLKPKQFAKSIWHMITGKKQTQAEKRFRPILLSYYDDYTENTESIEQQMQRSLFRARLETMNDLFQDIEELREQRLNANQIKKALLAKYNDPYRINRALDTELHEQAERTKLEQSKFMGYTHKQWNTQNDERVRKTNFHNAVSKKRIPIEQSWKIGTTVADYPGDIRLPPGERIFCRCYITYHNGPTGQ